MQPSTLKISSPASIVTLLQKKEKQTNKIKEFLGHFFSNFVNYLRPCIRSPHIRIITRPLLATFADGRFHVRIALLLTTDDAFLNYSAGKDPLAGDVTVSDTFAATFRALQHHIDSFV